MHIQKSSVYSGAPNPLLRTVKVEAERQAHRRASDGEEVQGNRIPNEDRTTIPRTESGPANTSGIRIHTIDRQKLFELNPKLDRKTRNAIDTYESLQHQNDVEQRESVSKLLGIDLYA